MVNKTTGLSKGYGFVSFAYKKDSTKAIEEMDGFRVSLSRNNITFRFYSLNNSSARKETIKGTT